MGDSRIAKNHIMSAESLESLREMVRSFAGNSEQGTTSLDKAERDSECNLIYPGDTVTLPDGSTYTVQEGDTLFSIAQQFDIEDFRSLCGQNNQLRVAGGVYQRSIESRIIELQRSSTNSSSESSD